MSTTEHSVFELDPGEVKVKDGLPRYRKTLSSLTELLESFKKFGQLQPIVLNRNKELIAGGRRLGACILGQRKALCIYTDMLEPIKMREAEIEENLQREDLSPADELLAIADLHKLKQELYGKAESGKKGGHTLDNTAALVGKTRGAIIDDLQLATAVKAFPELKDCKTKSDIRKAVKAANKVVAHAEAVEEYESQKDEIGENPTLLLKDARDHMPTVPDKSVDILATDPPFGIDIDKVLMGMSGKTGGRSTAGFKFDDDIEEALALYKILAEQSYRFCTDKAHAYIFAAPEFFDIIRNMFVEAGWLCSIKPIIWIKGSSGQCQMPSYWPSSCYDMILYCRKSESRLILEGRPDWIQFPPVHSSVRIHPTEKPVPLFKELISRCVYPSSILYDPFMGSGSSIEAGLDLHLFCTGCDNLAPAYNAAIARILKWNKKKEK